MEEFGLLTWDTKLSMLETKLNGHGGQEELRWVDLGWLPGAHPASLSLPVINRTGEGNKMKKSEGKDGEITYQLPLQAEVGWGQSMTVQLCRSFILTPAPAWVLHRLQFLQGQPAPASTDSSSFRKYPPAPASAPLWAAVWKSAPHGPLHSSAWSLLPFSSSDLAVRRAVPRMFFPHSSRAHAAFCRFLNTFSQKHHQLHRWARLCAVVGPFWNQPEPAMSGHVAASASSLRDALQQRLAADSPYSSHKGRTKDGKVESL